ncbi:hypothetical protein C8Q76DRAFT_618720 [Earliella scabrosa]|nr:hypothetical protein C8Q76DRAFT_618720 [Earliella scabrosa]
MYLVGVIPGPKKPSTVEINHFTSLLVDELLLFWTPGVRYSRTSLCPCGVLVRAAMIPLVCDLVGARQVAGVGPYNHNRMLCTCCDLEQDDIESAGVGRPRDLEAHIAAATAWRDAESTFQRENLFKANGIRWTELLRLGYWNPLLYVVIDSMHNLYLGLLQRHIRDYWGIAPQVDDGDASGLDTVKAPPRPSQSVMETGLDCLLHGSNSELAACGKPVLYHLCLDRNLRRVGTVKMLMRHLIAWVRLQGTNPPPSIQRRSPAKPTAPPKLVGSGALVLQRAKSSEGLINRGLPTLRYMCSVRGLSLDGTRAILAYRLWSWVSWSQSMLACQRHDLAMPGSFTFVGPAPLPRAADNQVRAFQSTLHGTAALGQQTMKEYVRDRSHLQLPNWVNPAPLAFGTSEHGKLSADQWRTVALISLPITLIRTWGLESGRRCEMLVNFLHLVEAVATLGYLEVDKYNLALADKLLKKYLEGVKELYKGAKIEPNHHAALHLTMFIALFGPVHAWRAFAFERLNFMMQSLNINNNFGDLEMTFMMQLSRMANLRPVLRTEPVRRAMPNFTAAYDKVSGEDRRGMRFDALMRSPSTLAVQIMDPAKSFSTVALDDEVYRALRARLQLEGIPYKGDGPGRQDSGNNPRILSRRVIPCKTLSIRGVLYKCQRKAQGDSNIVFRHPKLSNEEPGRIEQMFTHGTMDPRATSGSAERLFLVVRPLKPLSPADQTLDPYRQYTVGGTLYYDQYEPGLFVIRPEEVICHFAKTSMKGARFTKRARGSDGSLVEHPIQFAQPCVHVLRLDKVSR